MVLINNEGVDLESVSLESIPISIFDSPDNFGAYLTAIVDKVRYTAHGTGRTSRMLSEAKQGDVIICCNSIERDAILRYYASKKMLPMIVFAIRPDRLEPDKYRLSGIRTDNVHFTHQWIERYYLEALFQARNQIRGLLVPRSCFKPFK
jgi:hypothetical protein